MAKTGTKKIHIKIVTPYELFYEGDAESIIVPALDGEIGIMPGRTPVIIALTPGELRMVREGECMYVSVASGYADIEFDSAIVVVNAAERPEQIDMKRAQKALERAQARINDPKTSGREIERSKRSALRAKARLKVGRKVEKDELFD